MNADDTKLFEVRDAGTFIPVLATRIAPVMADNSQEAYLMRRAGYGEPCILLCRLECSGVDRNATYDPYAWGGGTLSIAHKHILNNWHALATGDVIDVEYLLGTRKEPKRSERFDNYER